MKVFLTGGTGYIGSFITLELLRGGHEVTILARNPGKIPSFLETSGITLIAGDVTAIGQIETFLPGHQACIHNALVWGDEQSDDELADSHASLALFKSAAAAGIEQMIYTSSVAVHRPFQSHMNEESRLAPVDSYGATKACNEILLSSVAHQINMRCNVVRPGPTVGAPISPSGPFQSDRRFVEFVSTAKEGGTITVAKNDGRQFIAASDLSRVYAAILTSSLNRETFLAVAADFITWEEVAQVAVAQVGSGSVIVEGRNIEPHQFDAGKLQKTFGLQFSARDAMQEHIRYIAD